VVLMGDAAHAMVPHQGQGANQTIEDAVVLADCVADHDLARYVQLRRKRTIGVQWASRRTADLMHLLDGAPDFRDIPSRLAWIHGHDALSPARGALDPA